MKKLALVAPSVVALASVIGLSSPAYADIPPVGGTSEASSSSPNASFEGHTITLDSGWGGATACLIWRSHGIAECFATEEGLEAREHQLRPTSTTSNSSSLAATATCSSSLDLYSGSNYTGLHLALWDEGYWQELSDYGFDNSTRSFVGGACGFHLAQGYYGQGYWYPGNTGAWSFSPDMGTWDNTVSSVYIS